MLICLVHGLIFGVLASSNAPDLSSKAVQWICGIGLASVKPSSFSSCIKFIIRIVSLRDCDKAMYSASVVESAIWVCSFKCQIRGQPCIQITYPDLLFAVLASCCDTSCLHSPENDASACTSKDLFESGFIRIPLSFVAMRYFAICLTASACDSFGFEENRAHWCTANYKSGRDPFSRKFSFPITDL